ncbi:MAG: hypothetical protein GDA52_03465 [Rhodobacteraceae bacterium]|nr:hypothetical protein [Paracoccaceae bacterium]
MSDERALRDRILKDRAEIASVARMFDKRPSGYFLMALLFGPFHLLYHKFWGKAAVALLLALFALGFSIDTLAGSLNVMYMMDGEMVAALLIPQVLPWLVSAVLAIPAWNQSALEQAERWILLDRVGQIGKETP